MSLMENLCYVSLTTRARKKVAGRGSIQTHICTRTYILVYATKYLWKGKLITVAVLGDGSQGAGSPGGGDLWVCWNLFYYMCVLLLTSNKVFRWILQEEECQKFRGNNEMSKMDPLCVCVGGSCAQAIVRTLNCASLMQLYLHHWGQMFFQIPQEEDMFYRESWIHGWQGDSKKRRKRRAWRWAKTPIF